MLNPPDSVIESWPLPNYVNPETQGPALLVLSIVLSVLSVAAVAGRLYSRLYILRNAGLDDLLIVIAMIPTISLSVIIPLAVYNYGWNRHIWDIEYGKLAPARKISWFAQISFVLSTSTVRVSILLFYRRVTRRTIERSYLWLIYGAIAFNVGYAIAFLGTLLFGCRPLHAYWDQVSPFFTGSFSCIKEGDGLLASAFLSLFIDMVVLALPSYLLYGMQMPVRQKLSLMALLGVGVLVCVANSVRTYHLWNIIYTTYDETWEGYNLWTWTFVENDVAIICSCAPAFKPFLKKYLGGSLPSGGDRKRYRVTPGDNSANIFTFGSSGSMGLKRLKDTDVETSFTTADLGTFSKSTNEAKQEEENVSKTPDGERYAGSVNSVHYLIKK